MLRSMNNYNGPFPDGVPNPYRPMLHSYPTRYHGPIYTRPMYALPWRERPDDFTVTRGTEGLGADDYAFPPAWKWAVALTLASGVVFVAVKMSDKKARA